MFIFSSFFFFRKNYLLLSCVTSVLYTKHVLVRSHFDYVMIIWQIKHLPYSERFQILKLPTMAYCRTRGDMIEVFKIVAHIYDSKTTSNVLNFREKLNKN